MILATNIHHRKTDTFRDQLDHGIIPWAKITDEGNQATEQRPLSTCIERLDTFIQNTDSYIYYGYNTDLDDLYPACYIGATDTIGMPYTVHYFELEDHRAILNYYHILLHELGHWTRHPMRLNRAGGHPFGTKAYALEELTAELTAVFVLNRHHITELPVEDEQDYLAKWQAIIALFGDDRNSLTTAELQACKACDYLFGLQKQTTSPLR